MNGFAYLLCIPSETFPSSVSDLDICSQAHLLIYLFPAELVKEMESAVPCIVELLKDTNDWVRHSAVTALYEMTKQRK